MLLISILFCFSLCYFGPVTGQRGLSVNIITNGSYSLSVNGVTWLTSGNTFFNNGGRQYSTADKSLSLLSCTATSGRDGIGQWQSTSFNYQAGSLQVSASIKTYNMPDLPLVIFSQTYTGSANRAAGSDSDHVISSFPSFKTFPGSPTDLGYLAYGGYHSGYSGLSMGRWQSSASFATGKQGGPLVIFDNSSNALVISPMSQFMAASNQLSLVRQELNYGIMGLVDSVPANYSVDFIVYYSNRGINQAMASWGKFLLSLYQKNSFRRQFDTTLSYMGYWTDNGAYYYYNPEKGKNYETTILDVMNYVNSENIPFQYTQYDSWWYDKGHVGGALTWTPTADAIPDGFGYLANKTKVPFSCHNRFWDNQTAYAQYNGGKYLFVSDQGSGLAVPDDDQFWIDLFNMTQRWGPFIMYEQDWLQKETDENKIILTDLDIGRKWLVGMGRGAETFGEISIQYCSAYSKHILQSLEIPTVTQTRVSHDYNPGLRQWDIGVTSMFVDAVGLAPYKDTFWTTQKQPGSPYKTMTEPQPELHSVLATLSTGPVGPGDGIGFINLTVLMRCCDSSGQILQPSKPATAIDDQIKKRAFSSYPGPDGEVYTTYTNISGYAFGIVLAADLKNSYALTPSSGWTSGQLPPSVIYSGTSSTKIPVVFSDTNPLYLGPECTPVNFCLYYTSPILQLGVRTRVILLGETSKWVPLSVKRFYSIQRTMDDIVLTLLVNAFEVVTFSYMVDFGPVQTILCDNSQSSNPAFVSTISILQKQCTIV
ncbi:uncharacterized protein LOC106054416 [Biomphalaria glabrata]|uniref:Uncharacterized protein LOC106054416 n=1 Tax=Biomphalaria glabrata TaxID=6526 RepID=A0A9W3BHM6_BIOGL|nr:uncharacterized protein LOC106054416 [Biomphalaria glabrata]